MDEYIGLDKLITVTDTRGIEHETTVRHILDLNKGKYEADDVAPVVRCKDCDLWNEWDHSGRMSLGNYRCSCAYWSVEDGPVHFTGPEDFCSYGEPREEESDGNGKDL